MKPLSALNRSLFFSILLLAAAAAAIAQPRPSGKSTEAGPILMNCSAHPDDEDGATLAYYQRLKHFTTCSIFYTKGEGGQNETGPELGRDLGILRTRETLRASRILGSKAYFLDFPDFGFSKTARETFNRWRGKDRVLARIVYYIRALKPDVIITNHDTVTTPPNRQHGNHQAVGITVYEAFDSAASPTYHPEQLKGPVAPWQVKKLFFRVFRSEPPHRDSVVVLNMEAADSTGTSIEQIALNALAQHKTQGMDKLNLAAVHSRFREHRYYLVRSDRPYPFDSTDLFSGIRPSVRTVALLHPHVDTIPRPVTQETLPDKAVAAIVARGCTIGLVKTYDNTTEEILRRFPVKYTLLDSAAVASGDLDDYSTIVLDLRAYAYRPDLVQNNGRFLEYARHGGNLVVLYNKTGDWNGKNFAPFPLTLTDERVTEEDAPVTVLEPGNRFFTTPNMIVKADWGRWVQERSLYLPSDDTAKTSAAYHRLLSMSDTGEQQPPTSLLWAPCGKGTYTYIALALYRQIRVMHEGGVRLFLNIISQQRH